MVTEVQIEKVSDYANGVTIYNEGVSCVYEAGSDKFKRVCCCWQNMLEGSHQMPAFGVSINDLTVREMKEGVWVEFTFDRQYSNGGMPFSGLLVNVQPSWTGFNIIRYTKDRGYDGRCFYFDLVGRDMTEFYNCITE